MGNMAYCRFENTLGDLRDCKESLDNQEEVSGYEKQARDQLIQVCIDIAVDSGYLIGKSVEVDDE